MKNFIFLMTLSFVILYGCAKEEAIITTVNPDDLNGQQPTSAWAYSTDGEYEYIDIPTNSNSVITDRGGRRNTAISFGNFHGYSGTLVVTYTGAQNNSGSTGSAEIQVTQGGFAHVKLETVCLSVIGNEAIYGGIITEVIANTINPPPPPPPPPGIPPPPPPSCNPYDLGSYVYFRVIDNGPGNNAPLDQYVGIFNTCNPVPGCAASFPWFIFGPPKDVENQTDQIRVY